MRINDLCALCTRRNHNIIQCKKGHDQTKRRRSCGDRRIDFEKVNKVSKMIEHGEKKFREKQEREDRKQEDALIAEDVKNMKG